MPMYTCKCVTCHEQVTIFRPLSDFGNWPEHCGAKMQLVRGKVHIIKDIEPYKAVAHDTRTGHVPVIKSRADHREYLKANGYEEVGNEKPKPQGEASRNLKGQRSDVLRAFKQILGK